MNMNIELVMQILISALMFSSVFLLIWSLFRFPVPPEPPEHRRLAVAMGTGRRDTLFEQSLFAPVMAATMTVAGRLSFPALRSFVTRNLNASGNPNNYSVTEYLAVCLFTGAIVAVLTFVLSLLLSGVTAAPISAVVMGLIGFCIPLWTVYDAATKRMQRISKKLPYAIDLIALMMEAGSTFSEAVATMIRDDPEDDFNQELALVQAEIEFGTPRGQALANMAERVPLDSLRTIIGAVNQAEALGTPLSTILKAQSGMIRMHRSVRAEKLSASASLRILIPSMLILLAVIVIIFGPMVIRWAASGFSLTFD